MSDTPDTTRLSDEAVHPSWMPDDAFLDYMEQRFSQLIDRCDGLTNDMTPARRATYKSTDIGYLSMRLLNRHRTLAAELARVEGENARLRDVIEWATTETFVVRPGMPEDCFSRRAWNLIYERLRAALNGAAK